MQFVQARNYTKANRTFGDVTLVVIHTAECGESSKAAENVAAWGAGPNASKASWHYVVDCDSEVQSVHEKDVAWHAGPVNGFSIGVEHAGYAAQTPSQWADSYTVATLERSAKLVADVCIRHGIPVRRLTADDLKRGERRGICGHVDVTNGLTGGKGHYDPGPNFPWESYLARVMAIVAGEQEPEPSNVKVTPDEVASLLAHPEMLVQVELDGVVWEVSPIYCGAPVKIGEAARVAAELGFELPTPALCDAIWRQADLRVNPAAMIQSHDGTAAGMNSTKVLLATQAALIEQVGNRSLAVDYRLLDGAFKNVVRSPDGKKIGLYGWHVESKEVFEAIASKRKFSLPLHAPATPGPGLVVQQPFYGHSEDWGDYSQSFRIVRKRKA